MLTKSRLRLAKSSGGARGLGGQAVEDDGHTCRDRGGGVADMLLRGLVVWASKPPADVFSGLGLKNQLEFQRNGRRHVASPRSLRRGKAKS